MYKMNITEFPTELLPAFCAFPRAGLALRLTCADFYIRIPPPRELFKKIGNSIWANDFWLVGLVRIGGTINIIHCQYRKCDPLEPTADNAPIPGYACVSALSTLATLPHVTTGWNNAAFMWRSTQSYVFINNDYGIDLVEDPSKIFVIQGILYAGTQKAADMFATVDKKDDPELVLAFKKPIDFGGGRRHDLIHITRDDISKFIGCEYDCKIFRRKSPPRA
jgi:hypothetical protein